MKRQGVLALSSLPLMAVSGCSGSFEIGRSAMGMPQCPAQQEQTPGDLSSALLLVAQSVPTATRLPCVRALAAGWTFRRLDARTNRARFTLDSDREGASAVTVTLERNCDVSAAAEVASDEAGTHRFDRVASPSSGYRGDRFYVYDGGCVTYHLNLGGKTGAEPVQAISEMLQFVDRDVLRRYVHHYSDGRFELDAAPASGRLMTGSPGRQT
ncbi:MAG: hypothetical protein QOI26_1252 [Pseudonocardiales bacterium]|nr:hypothetical protein [Pseudonocardiales bacterium]